MKTQIMVLISCLILLAACKQKNPASIDSSKPVFTVVEPVSNDTSYLSVEPEVHIEFTTTDNVALSTLVVQLLDSNSNMIGSWSPSVSGLAVYPFHQHVMPTGITTVVAMKAKMVATDLSGNTETKEISFYVAP